MAFFEDEKQRRGRTQKRGDSGRHSGQKASSPKTVFKKFSTVFDQTEKRPFCKNIFKKYAISRGAKNFAAGR